MHRRRREARRRRLPTVTCVGPQPPGCRHLFDLPHNLYSFLPCPPLERRRVLPWNDAKAPLGWTAPVRVRFCALALAPCSLSTLSSPLQSPSAIHATRCHSSRLPVLGSVFLHRLSPPVAAPASLALVHLLRRFDGLPVFLSADLRGTRRVHLVRGGGRDVSTLYGREGRGGGAAQPAPRSHAATRRGDTQARRPHAVRRKRMARQLNASQARGREYLHKRAGSEFQRRVIPRNLHAAPALHSETRPDTLSRARERRGASGRYWGKGHGVSG